MQINFKRLKLLKFQLVHLVILYKLKDGLGSKVCLHCQRSALFKCHSVSTGTKVPVIRLNFVPTSSETSSV